MYVMGDVIRPGGYAITTNDARLSVLQVVAMAGSANKTSMQSKVRLIRATANGQVESPVRLDQIREGQAAGRYAAAERHRLCTLQLDEEYGDERLVHRGVHSGSCDLRGALMRDKVRGSLYATLAMTQLMTIGGWIHRLLIVGFALCLWPYPANAIRPSAISVASTLHLQEGSATLGKLHVPAEKMAGQCITMVSPSYPHTADDLQTESTVIVQAVISKSGRVSPMRAVSGSPVLEAEAMNAVRLWRYKPFIQDQEPVDVTTEIQVNFKPGEPGGIITHPNH